MKNIKQIREAYNVSTNKSEAEDRKLSSLVECGLLDANKLPALKEAMNKPVDQMSSQEKRMFLNLLESLISEMQVRQTKDIKDYFATPDPRVKRAGYPSQKEAPSVLLLKRKAIRVFPDGQKVALYYAQAIDKYVSIPYNEIGINEQTAPRDRESEEEERANTSTSSALSDLRAGVKASTPMRAGGSRLNVTSPIGDPNVKTRTAIDSYMERLQRRANQAMAQNEAYAGAISRAATINWKPIADTATDIAKNLLKGTTAKTVAKSTLKGLATRTPAGRILSTYLDMITPAGSKQEREWELANVRRQQAEKSSRAQRWPGQGTLGLGNKAEKISRTATMDDIKPISVPKREKDVAGAGEAEAAANVKGKAQEIKVPESRKDVPAVRYIERQLEKEAERKKADIKTQSATAGTVAAPADSISTPEARKKSTEKAINATQDRTKARTDAEARARARAEAEAGTLAAVASRRSSGPRNRGQKQRRKAPDFPEVKLNMPGKKETQPGTPSLRLAVSGPTGKPHTALDAADLIRSRKAMMAQAAMSESVNLDGNIFELNNITAQKVKSLYESLNRKNKKKMIEMMSESNESFNKVISFAVRQ
jgi:hypothetical protein